MALKPTLERNKMSKKTSMKRLALALVASLGFGLLSSGPSASVGLADSASLTLTASATSIEVGDTVTITAVSSEVGNPWAAADSRTISISVESSITGSPAGFGSTFYARTSDTLNATEGSTLATARTNGVYFTGSSAAVPDSFIPTVTTAGSTMKYTQKIYLYNALGAGTYNVTVSYKNADQGNAPIIKTASLTITVTAPAMNNVKLYRVKAADVNAGIAARLAQVAGADTAISGAAGKAETPTAVGYIWPVVRTSLNDTLTAAGNNLCTTQPNGYCVVQVAITGAGLISVDAGTTKARTATMNLYNSTTALNSSETLIVYSDGTAGTGTIAFSAGSVSLGSTTVSFAGTAASATLHYVDTIITNGTASTIKAFVKDSAGNAVTTGSVYIYAADTSIISESATACSYSSTLGYHSCSVTPVDTGTTTVVVRNTATQGATTAWVSDSLSFTVRGEKLASITASFDKATYEAGEKAVLTITGKDRLGNTMGGAAITSAFRVTSNKSFTDITTPTTFDPLLTTDGVETRVVYMPTSSGEFTYTISTNSGSWPELAEVTVKATVNPSASEVASNAAQAAADAATDAALEAIDAANAATDAANLAAEAADAATVAAEEARDAADAATAAVEALATEVATLMAALKAQITTLAKTVAKIAKKVKA